MQIVQVLFGGLLAHKLISIIVTLVIAGVLVMLVTDADFITSAADKVGGIVDGESSNIVSWITDYIIKVINMFKANMS